MLRKRTQTKAPGIAHNVPADPELEKLQEIIRQAEKALVERQAAHEARVAAAAAQAAEPVVPSPSDLTLPVNKRIELALTHASLETPKLAKVIGETLERTVDAVRELRTAGMVVNVNFEEHPVWRWRVGESVSNPTLRAIIKDLISERPMWTKDLVRVTGVKESRVSGELVDLQRTHDVRDMSGGGHAKLYFLMTPLAVDAQMPKVFLMTDRVRDARLPPKVVKKKNGKP